MLPIIYGELPTIWRKEVHHESALRHPLLPGIPSGKFKKKAPLKTTRSCLPFSTESSVTGNWKPSLQMKSWGFWTDSVKAQSRPPRNSATHFLKHFSIFSETLSMKTFLILAIPLYCAKYSESQKSAAGIFLKRTWLMKWYLEPEIGVIVWCWNWWRAVAWELVRYSKSEQAT